MTTSVQNESYRDTISTVSKEGKRVWIYPKKPNGRFHNARIIVSAILVLILIGLPIIKVNEHPLFLLNVFDREFILFGLIFGPQDFHLFVLAFITVIVFIVLFTAIFGRVFCGWACPQTIFMEMVFRKIEYWIEGDFRQQIALDKSPLTGVKYIKKSAKHIIFFGLAFFISHVFMAYIIGLDNVINVITQSPARHLTGFIGLLFFTILFYFVFARFREQACTIVCPYGRLQSVLLDQNSLVVAYDEKRGEPRGKLKKDEVRNEGDCIDCHLCVDVCPTGIDIRNGIQMECVNCTACIDACDEVMEKINKPRGLVRYSSLNGLKEGTGFKITPRIIAYTALLTLLIAILTLLLLTRTDYSINILRIPGMLYQDQPDNKISNLYNLNVINKTYQEKILAIEVNNFDAEIKLIGDDLKLSPQKTLETRFMIILNKDDLDMINVPLEILIYENGKEIARKRTTFLSHKGAKKNEK